MGKKKKRNNSEVGILDFENSQLFGTIVREKSKMTGMLILSNWEDGGTSDYFLHFFFFFKKWKTILCTEKVIAGSQHVCASSHSLKPTRVT